MRLGVRNEWGPYSYLLSLDQNETPMVTDDSGK